MLGDHVRQDFLAPRRLGPLGVRGSPRAESRRVVLGEDRLRQPSFPVPFRVLQQRFEQINRLDRRRHLAGRCQIIGGTVATRFVIDRLAVLAVVLDVQQNGRYHRVRVSNRAPSVTHRGFQAVDVHGRLRRVAVLRVLFLQRGKRKWFYGTRWLRVYCRYCQTLHRFVGL